MSILYEPALFVLSAEYDTELDSVKPQPGGNLNPEEENRKFQKRYPDLVNQVLSDKPSE